MIDKSLRYRYAWGGPGGKSPSAPGRSGPPGGGDRQMSYSAPAPSPHRPDPVPTRVVTTAKAPPKILAQLAVEPVKSGDDFKQSVIDIGFQEALRKEKIAEDLKEKLDKDFDFQDNKGKAPTTFKPKIEKYITHSPFTDKPIINERVKKYYSPPYDPSTDPNALLDRGSGILGTLGKVALTGLTAGAGAGLFGKELAYAAKGLRYKKNYDKLQKSALGKKLKLKELDFSNVKSTIQKGADLRSRPKGMPEHLGERGFRIRDDTPPRDGDGPKTLAETVTQGAGLAEGQKMLGLDDKQIQQIYQGRDLLKQTIESGMYQDRKLNMNEIKMLQAHMMKIENLIQAIEKAQAPVPVAHGGLIDKPFTGRSRDI